MISGKGMGGHHSAKALKNEWLTPPELIKTLGEFDLDPCSPINRPWSTAKNHFTIEDDGLALPGKGRVWLNPPYGNQTGVWLNKLHQHGNGIALVFARTETNFFFSHVWNSADALFFIRRRLFFYHVTGIRAKYDSGAPSVLIAYGNNNVLALQQSSIKGKFIPL